jgi:hypothetical protein
MAPKRFEEVLNTILADTTLGRFVDQFKNFFIKPECNTLERMIFPFPHQPSLQKVFYRDRLSAYISFVKKTFGEDQMIP